jgi:hypothetical protein
MQLSFEAGAWWLIPVLLLAVFAAWWLYRRSPFVNAEGKSKPVVYVMGALRALAIFLLLILFLRPYVQLRKNEVRQPLMLVFADRSQSMAFGGDSAALVRFFANELPELAGKVFEPASVRMVSFGCGGDVPSDGLAAPCTNLESALHKADELYAGQNIGAVVVVSDGLVNQGMLPVHAAFPFRAPLYTLGWGDTTRKPDVAVRHVQAPRVVFMGNQFMLEADILAEGVTGKNLEVKLLEGGKTVATTTCTPAGTPPYARVAFRVDAGSPGLRHFIVQVQAVNSEQNLGNNTAHVYVDVIDQRQKVALVYHSPHPDIGAIRSAFSTAPAYTLEVFEWPAFAGEINRNWDLVIFHQLPGEKWRVRQQLDQLKARGTNMFFVLGGQSRSEELRGLDPAFTLAFQPGRTSDAQAIWNSSFTAFDAEPGWKESLESWPPLTVPFGNYSFGPGLEVVAWQKIGAVATQQPLVAFSGDGGSKMGWICGEGIWRWRVKQFMRDQSHEQVDRMLMKWFQYAAVRINRKLFSTEPSKRLYGPGEKIVFDAHILDKTMQPVSGKTIALKVYNDQGFDRRFNMSPSGTAYRLDAGFLPAGDYRYTAETPGIAEKETGVFSVSSASAERMNLTADWKMLREWSGKNNGAFAPFAERNRLFESIKRNNRVKPVLQSEVRRIEPPDLWWYLALVLVLLCSEWLLRRISGGY